ncbi:hypothetical protein F441_17262 [Phytophthora nicotianae CJ01A1]|uniref:RxLR effector protein n=4 Tax=Phytophthora nicotianae TaxID=4792 RepID=W2QY53_PHYN3|nr:hypothetical protein PPTG_21531 [Phytophthora nicotianae INRA-310]ETK76743.1 hypothetical protein L915_16917 [Phytophthora nicotianae]ETO58550.1 hypothetical protein F444_23072 [Phytophthora nicotianae P1976]ETP06336.1 hypothetical protein F441_17262 [Phytophthora nicotianae CJ01A1]ETN18152.1 hypothetical protein PPTG_21531 [Phytophthora nicotianae INRA-310]ETO65233.1 hypothetical protein F444_17433 [Phytophthora nicotianae P1976]
MRLTIVLGVLTVVIALILATDAIETADNDKNNVRTSDTQLNEERAVSGGPQPGGIDSGPTQAWTNFKKWFKKWFKKTFS